MAKSTYTYEYSDEHGDYTIRKFKGTDIAYKIYDTYDGKKDDPQSAMRRSIEERKAQGKDVSFLEKRLKDKPEAKETKETSEKEDNGEPKLEYQTDFHLAAPVNDFEAAQAYLSEDDMTQYVPEELKDVVKDVKWELDDEESGHISFKTTRELTAEESKAMSDWIDGQNSDGLGEGFEQQDFATSYYDPYSGEGPYTYDEYQREIENRFDNLDSSEYADYLSDDAVEQGIQSWMEENGVDHIETDEEYERAREDVLDDPESYIDWEDIDAAKNDYLNDNEDLKEDSWYNMSSIRDNKAYGQEQNEFKVSDIETSETNDELWIKQEDGTLVANMEAQKKDYEERHKRYDEKIAQLAEDRNKMTNSDWEGQVMAYAQQNADGTYNTMEQIMDDVDAYEKTKVDNPIAAAKRDLAIEPGSDEESRLNELYEEAEDDTDWSRYDEFIEDLRENKNKGMNYEEWLKEHNDEREQALKELEEYSGMEADSAREANVPTDAIRRRTEELKWLSKTENIAKEFLNPDNEYTDAWLQQQAEANGIEIADLDREIGRQMREGMSYGQRKRETANSAERAQRIINNDEWYDVTVNQKGMKATLTDERTGKSVSLDPYDSDDVIKSKLNELRPGKPTERNVPPIPFENTDRGYYFFDDNPDATDEDFRKAKEEYNKQTGYEKELNNWYKREYGKSLEEIEAEHDAERERYRTSEPKDYYKSSMPSEYLLNDYKRLKNDPQVANKERWSQAYEDEVLEAGADDLNTTIDNFVKNNPRWEDGEYDELEAEEMFEKMGTRRWAPVYDRIYEKAHDKSRYAEESIQDRYGLKDKRNELTVFDYEQGVIDEEELTDLLTRGNENKETINRIIDQNTPSASKTMNTTLRNAYEEYLKKNPGSRMSFEVFTRRKK